MSLPAYAEYKDSGVEWLGDVPKHWDLKKLKFLCKVQTGDKDTINAVENGEYPFFVRSQTIERINSFTYDCEAVLTAGDGVGVGKVFHYVCGKFDFHQRVYMMNHFKHISGQFFFLYLSELFAKVALDGGAKSTVDSLRMPLFLNFIFSVPPLPEQTTIARFLDYETAKIDALIAEQQRLIELLKEKRQAVISHAVTKGLDPNAPMKDSGVAWLGDVPEHWVVTKIKNACYINDGNHGEEYPTADDFTESEEGVPFIRAGNIKNMKIDGNEMLYIKKSKNDSMRKGRLKEGDVLFTNRGEIGKVATVSREFSGSNLNSQIAYLRASNNVLDGEFLAYFLGSDTIFCSFDSNSAGSVLTQFPIKDIERLPLVLPSVNEQIQVSKFLDQQTTKIDELISHAHQGIDLLKERRSALISAAVTGKIDVRGWQPPATAATTPQGQQQILFDD